MQLPSFLRRLIICQRNCDQPEAWCTAGKTCHYFAVHSLVLVFIEDFPGKVILCEGEEKKR